MFLLTSEFFDNLLEVVETGIKQTCLQALKGIAKSSLLLTIGRHFSMGL